MKRLIIILVTIILTMTYNHAAISGNWGCIPLIPGGCEKSTSTLSSNAECEESIGDLIGDATYQYILANSEYQKFLSQIELGEHKGYNFIELTCLANGSLTYINKAIRIYSTIVLRVSQCSYDDFYIKKLSAFDYANFQKNNNLNASIFSITKYYLKSGDIKGIFKKFYTDSLNIESTLKSISAMVEIGNLPDYNLIWQCNQTFFQTHLFGQYISMVFYAIIK